MWQALEVSSSWLRALPNQDLQRLGDGKNWARLDLLSIPMALSHFVPTTPNSSLHIWTAFQLMCIVIPRSTLKNNLYDMIYMLTDFLFSSFSTRSSCSACRVAARSNRPCWSQSRVPNLTNSFLRRRRINSTSSFRASIVFFASFSTTSIASSAVTSK